MKTDTPKICELDNAVVKRHREYLEQNPSGMVFTFVKENATWYSVRCVMDIANLDRKERCAINGNMFSRTRYNSLKSATGTIYTLTKALSKLSRTVVDSGIDDFVVRTLIGATMMQARKSSLISNKINFIEVDFHDGEYFLHMFDMNQVVCN